MCGFFLWLTLRTYIIMNSKFKSGLKKDEDRVSSLRNKKQKVYERQIKASEQAVINLSELKTEIMRKKSTTSRYWKTKSLH